MAQQTSTTREGEEMVPAQKRERFDAILNSDRFKRAILNVAQECAPIEDVAEFSSLLTSAINTAREQNDVIDLETDEDEDEDEEDEDDEDEDEEDDDDDDEEEEEEENDDDDDDEKE